MVARNALTRGAPTALRLSETVCTDEDYTIVDDDCFVRLVTTGAGSRTLTFPTTSVQGSGRLLWVQQTALSTGTYATSGVLGGEVTFDADENSCLFVSEDGVGWHALRLTDASIQPSEVVTGDIADAAVTPAKLSATLIAPAADAACALLNTTTQVVLTVTAGGAVAISTTSSVAGQRITLIADAVSGGGSYTLALVSGTLTLNSTGETALIERTNANDGWRAIALTAGVAGGAPATVV